MIIFVEGQPRYSQCQGWPSQISVHVDMYCYSMAYEKATFIDSKNCTAKTWTGCFLSCTILCSCTFLILVHAEYKVPLLNLMSIKLS